MGKPWENHGKTMGKPWENTINDGKSLGLNGYFNGKNHRTTWWCSSKPLGGNSVKWWFWWDLMSGNWDMVHLPLKKKSIAVQNTAVLSINIFVHMWSHNQSSSGLRWEVSCTDHLHLPKPILLGNTNNDIHYFSTTPRWVSKWRSPTTSPKLILFQRRS